MKNILIIGCARAGKTTLAKMIKEKYPTMNLLLMDSIKNAVLRNLKNHDRSDVDKTMEYEYSDFNTSMLLECFESHIRNDKTKNGYIFEGSQLLPKKIHNEIKKYDIVVVCLGLGNITAKQIFENVRNFDNVLDWTYNVPDEELTSLCRHWEKHNNLFMNECPIYNIKYFNTTGDRKLKLEEVIKYIESNL